MHQVLLSYFSKITKLSEDEKTYLQSHFKLIHYNKGAFILKQGQVNHTIGFLNKGLVRYFVLKNGEEATFEFTREHEFIADYQSFTTRKPGIQYIQAIEDCEVLEISYEAVQYVFNNFPNGNLLGRLILEHRFEVMVNQLLAIYLQNKEERYHWFTKQYNDIMQRIPLYMIASFVGVKPQSLSRIRKRPH